MRGTSSQPHSVPLQQLAGGGLVALGLFGALVRRRGSRRASRALRGSTEASAPPPSRSSLRPLAYLLHALVDYNWDFLAVTAPDDGRARRPGGRGTGSGSPASAAGSRGRRRLCSPSCCSCRSLCHGSRTRASGESTRALSDGDYDARERPRRPGEVLQSALGRPVLRDRPHQGDARTSGAAAEEAYVDAVELQPENPETWYALGLFELQALAETLRRVRVPERGVHARSRPGSSGSKAARSTSPARRSTAARASVR